MVLAIRRLEVLTIVLEAGAMVLSVEMMGENGAQNEVRTLLMQICEPRRPGDARREGDGVGEADLPSTSFRCRRSKLPLPSLFERENE
jgi:hypothetical protein